MVAIVAENPSNGSRDDRLNHQGIDGLGVKQVEVEYHVGGAIPSQWGCGKFLGHGAVCGVPTGSDSRVAVSVIGENPEPEAELVSSREDEGEARMLGGSQEVVR